ncbi:unnamed protein product [Prunus armeniaca]|uniref:Tify domain-containing protein n=1 Tax=Prunus armeniaca TaxID=36596 RepID=A0A6J5VQ74_PRUAR|nr:unnamed protein product [Prunus armeniaca]
METVNAQPLQARAYEGEDQLVHVPAELEGDYDEGGGAKAAMNGGDQARMSSGVTMSRCNSALPSRTSELTIAFEGEVHVFPAATPDKVQAVLLLLGGRDISSSFPSSESLLESNSGATSHKIQNFHEELHLLLSSVKNGKRDALKRKFDTLVEKRLLRGMKPVLITFVILHGVDYFSGCYSDCMQLLVEIFWWFTQKWFSKTMVGTIQL